MSGGSGNRQPTEVVGKTLEYSRGFRMIVTYISKLSVEVDHIFRTGFPVYSLKNILVWFLLRVFCNGWQELSDLEVEEERENALSGPDYGKDLWRSRGRKINSLELKMVVEDAFPVMFQQVQLENLNSQQLGPNWKRCFVSTSIWFRIEWTGKLGAISWVRENLIPSTRNRTWSEGMIFRFLDSLKGASR